MNTTKATAGEGRGRRALFAVFWQLFFLLGCQPDFVAAPAAQAPAIKQDPSPAIQTASASATQPASAPVIRPLPNDSANPGTRYEKVPQMAVPVAAHWTKEFGPDEMTVDPETGAVSWDIPSNLPRESFHLGVRATNAGGSSYMTWILKVGGGKYVYVGPSERCKTIQAGTRAAASGDTVVVRDGRYAGRDNMVNNMDGGRGSLPPSGRKGIYTTLMAEHPGGAEIDGEGKYYPIYINGSYRDRSDHHFTPCEGSYLAIKGLVAHNAGTEANAAGAIEANHADHIKIVDCGAYDAQPYASPIYIARSHHMLVEGCYTWGRGRYQILFYICDDSIMRRNVGRMDAIDVKEPIGIFIIYAGRSNRATNNIAIDCDQYRKGRYRNFTNVIGAFGDQSGSSNYEEWATHLNNLHAASIALNLDGKITLTQRNEQSHAMRLHNVVGWDIRAIPNGHAELSASPPILTPDRLEIDQCTFGRWASPYFPLLTASGTTTSETVDGWASSQKITNSIFYDFRDKDGTPAGVFNSIEEARFNNVFGTGSINVKDTAAQNTIASDPMASCLRYLPRIEQGCGLARGGQAGARVGASVMYMRGRAGTLWADPGCDSEEKTPMWPFPHEELTREKMRAYAFPDDRNGGARGFCGEGQTLTNYVWGYLGHQVPPFRVTATAGPGKVTVAWDPLAGAAARGVRRYHLYRLEGDQKVRVATVAAGSAFSATVSGLTAGQRYTFAVTAEGESRGESGYSYPVTASPR